PVLASASAGGPSRFSRGRGVNSGCQGTRGLQVVFQGNPPRQVRGSTQWWLGVSGSCDRPRQPSSRRYRRRLAMYWTIPSGTRYQIGSPSATRWRQLDEEIA